MPTFMVLLTIGWAALVAFSFVFYLFTKKIDIIWLGAGALVALIISLVFPNSLAPYWIILIALATMVILYFTLGLYIKRRLRKSSLKINSIYLIGRHINVLEESSEFTKGRGSIDEVIWTTLSHPGTTHKKGDVATVIAIDNNTLIIK